MEPLIAVLILIGVLMVGGKAPDTEVTRSATQSASTATLADSEAKERRACDNHGPRQRDLTVPYISRTTPASMGAEACDD